MVDGRGTSVYTARVDGDLVVAKVRKSAITLELPPLPAMKLHLLDAKLCLIHDDVSLCFVLLPGRQILSPESAEDKGRLKEIQSEVELMQVFDHPNIARYRGSGLEEGTGRPFVCTELLDGGSLNQSLGFAPRYTGTLMALQSTLLFGMLKSHDSHLITPMVTMRWTRRVVFEYSKACLLRLTPTH